MKFQIKTKDGRNIEVAEKDYSPAAVYNGERRNLKLSDGWRLPTISELEMIHKELHKSGIGEFHEEWYWSRESHYVSWDYSVEMGYNFKEGKANAKGAMSHGLDKAYVRLVRDV